MPREGKFPCPKCGKAGCKTLGGRMRGTQYARFRTCISCGHKFETGEREVSQLSPIGIADLRSMNNALLAERRSIVDRLDGILDSIAAVENCIKLLERKGEENGKA